MSDQGGFYPSQNQSFDSQYQQEAGPPSYTDNPNAPMVQQPYSHQPQYFEHQQTPSPPPQQHQQQAVNYNTQYNTQYGNPSPPPQQQFYAEGQQQKYPGQFPQHAQQPPQQYPGQQPYPGQQSYPGQAQQPPQSYPGQQQVPYNVVQNNGYTQYLAPRPMRFQVKQKVFSFTGDMKIRDECGLDIFKARAKFLSLGLDMRVEDLQGTEVAHIKSKIMSWMPTYRVFRDGRQLCQVDKKFTFFKPKFIVTLTESGEELTVRGDFFSYEFLIYRGDQVSAKISKEYFSWTDTYGVEVFPGEDVVLMLCIAVIIDKCLHESD